MDNIIGRNASVREALALMEDIDLLKTLFVVDEEGHLVGTLTDGDIRRGTLSGKSLDDSVSAFMHRNFRSVVEGDVDVEFLKACREKGIFIIPVLDISGRLKEVINLKEKKSILPIDAVLMAGGQGKRLRPLTENTPKPLLKVGGKAIIDHTIDRLHSYGVGRICVTVNYLADQMIEHFKDAPNVECVQEQEFMGTIGSLRFVKDLGEEILVMNSDILTQIDYEAFYLQFRHSGADMCIATTPYDVSIPYGIMEFRNGQVKCIKEKPVFNYYANAGIYLIKKSVLDLIPEGRVFDATDLVNALAANGGKVVHFPINGIWIDIGSFEEYQKACELVARG